MMAFNLRAQSAISPRHSQTQEAKSGSLNISHQALQSYLYGREKVELIDQNERKRKATNTTGTSLSGEISPSKRLPSADSRDVQPTYAVRSFPAEVQLCTSSIPGVEYGVCAKQNIPSGTWIGPFEGKRLRPSDLTPDVDTGHIWEVYEKGQLSHYLDGNDENSSSWMRFIRCARHPGEQNMYAFQFCGSVFYRAFRDISIGTEMLVWYDVHYPQFMGIPLGLKDIQLISSLGGMQNGCHQRNALGVPVHSTSPTDTEGDGPVHRPKFSPVEVLTEDADGNISANQPSAVVPDDLSDMQYAPPAQLATHPSQQQQQQQQQQQRQQLQLQQQRQHRHQQQQHTQYHYKPHHIPNQHQQQQQKNHPNNYHQKQLQPRQHTEQQVYNRHHHHQQQQQQEQHHHHHQRQHQLEHRHHHQHHQHPPQQHLHQHQYKQQHQHQQRQHGHYRPESSFFISDSANHVDRKSPGSTRVTHTAPPTVPPLRSISQHTQSQQHASFWTHRNPRTLGPYQGDTRVIRSPDVQSAVTNTNPRAVLSRPPPAVVSSSPNQHPRTMLSVPPHPLKSAHVKPFHINTSSLVEITTKETTESGDETLRKPLVPAEPLVSLNGHQDGDGVQPGKTEIYTRQETTPVNETQPAKWVEENDEVDITKIDDEPPQDSLEKHFSMWKCKQCQKIFTHRLSLNMHVCSRQPKKPFQCGHCPLSFSTPSELRGHVDTHRSEKSFRCGFCARSFAGPTTLNNHVRTHTGEKPFNCDQCGKNFAQATNLARHQRIQGKCTD